MTEKISGYNVKYPFLSIVGSNGYSEVYPAMSKEVARQLIKDEAKRLGLNERDFSL